MLILDGAEETTLTGLLYYLELEGARGAEPGRNCFHNPTNHQNNANQKQPVTNQLICEHHP